MSSRRRLTPTDRRSVYNLTGGRCAYCGQELAFRDMQVDHVVPLHLGGADEAFNMFPACRSCNHYKRGMDLERWRAQLEAIPATLARDCYTYRQGVRFGLVMLPHGAWLPWLEEQVEFSERTARNFMRLARECTNRQALADLGAAKALTLLALPPEERAQFMEEHHTINGEDKTVIDMTSRELEQAIRERDKARLAAEAAQADAKSAEENRAKMEADMALLKEQCRSSQDAVAAAQKELEELKAKPVDVAVMAVDQEKLDAARAEAVAEMQAKVDKAKAARDKAEENRKAAEAALAEIRTKLEEAGKAERKAAIAGDSDLAVFQLLFEQAQEIANKLHGLLIKAQGREDSSQAAGMQKALSTLAELIRKAAEV